MLTKATLNKLKKGGWKSIEKNDSNPAQTWHRLRIQINDTLDHLALLAKTLPNDKQEVVFTQEKIWKLASALLTNPHSEALEPRRAVLACEFMRAAYDYCNSQYMKIEPHLDLRREITDPIHTGLRMCMAIADKVISRSRVDVCSNCGQSTRNK